MWTDNSAGIWIYGGVGNPSAGGITILGDLWYYNTASGVWTWKGGSSTTPEAGVYGTLGVAASENHPGAREMAQTWTGKDGKLWLFGGIGLDSTLAMGPLNDLWSYDPPTGLWTWVHGSNLINDAGSYAGLFTPSAANNPGARSLASGAVDAEGNLWLLGGNGRIPSDAANDDINDVWKFDVSSAMWILFRGSDRSAPIFGTQGVSDPANQPGAGMAATAWSTSDGNIWLFGGSTSRNVLWKYNPSTNQWTWMKGSNIFPLPTYSSKGVFSGSATPSMRLFASGWSDKYNRLWLYGGYGVDVTNAGGAMGDLWVYDPAVQSWAWMGGSNVAEQTPVYGTMGSVADGVEPGAMFMHTAVRGENGAGWIFGGELAAGGSNTLWKAQVTDSADLSVSISSSVPQITLHGTITYNVTVMNNGPDRADGTNVSIALPPASQFGSASGSLGIWTESGGVVTCALGVLSPGQTVTGTIVITPTVPVQTIVSAQVITTSVDPDPSNNSSAAAVNVVQGDGPDLVAGLTATPSCKSTRKGTQCRIKGTATITNSGNQEAVKNSLQVYLSADGRLDPSDQPIKTFTVKKVRIGSTISKKVQVKLPLNVPATGMFLIGVADSGSSVAEGNEFNNVVVFGPLP